jgi:hypothetical protein
MICKTVCAEPDSLIPTTGMKLQQLMDRYNQSVHETAESNHPSPLQAYQQIANRKPYDEPEA